MSEVNNIPKHWQMKKLSDLIAKNGVFCDGDWVESKDQDPTGEVRLIQLANIRDGYFRDKSDKHLTLKRANELNCTFLNQGDVLIARMPDPLGRCCLFPLRGKNKFVTVVDVAIIRSDENIINNKFLSYTINSPQIRNAINNLKSGTTRKRISRKNLDTIDFPVPPLPEQKAIVAKIEELLSDLENGKQQLQKAQQQLKIYRQSLLKAAFEGRLTNPDVKEGELPEGWKKIQVKEVADAIGGYAFKSSEFINSGKYQVLRIGNVRPGKIRYTEKPVFLNEIDDSILTRSLLHINDVIISQTGTRKKRDYGFTALIQKDNLLLNQRITAIRFKKSYSPKFFLYFSWTDFFKDQFFANETGNVGQGNVGMRAITETLIPSCSPKEQQQIVEELESKLTVCEKIEETISQSLQQAETLRQSILKKAFEGKLV